MGKKRADDTIKTLVEAIDFIKSVRETAPANQKIADALDRTEKEMHDELFELLALKVTTGK